MSLPDDYEVIKVSSDLASIKIYVEWDFDGVSELSVWLQNSVTGVVYYQNLSDFTVTEDSDVGGVFILVENNQGVSVDVSVARETPRTQTYDLSNSEALNPDALIATLDKTVKMIQEESLGYANQSVTSVNPFSIPDKVTRVDKLMGFDENGDFELKLAAGSIAEVLGWGVFEDQKASGTPGGTFNALAWQTRVLNTTVSNTLPGASLLANQITLTAGVYDISIKAIGFNVKQHKCKLVNITDVIDELIGLSNDTSGVSNVATTAHCEGLLTVVGTKVFEVQHRSTQTNNVDGFGFPSSIGVNEVYSQIKITKVG